MSVRVKTLAWNYQKLSFQSCSTSRLSFPTLRMYLTIFLNNIQIRYKTMLRKISTLNRSRPLLYKSIRAHFANPKNKGYKVIDNPAEISKLVFNEDGICTIYQYKTGENTLKKLVRYITGLTFLNGMLFGLQSITPIFGKVNLISFGLVTGLGYMMLGFLQLYSKRIVHRLHIENDFQTVHLEFFNAFWKPQTLKFNLSEFQEPIPSFADFTRFELTQVGKIWINLNKNEFKKVADYEQTLEYILLGKPLKNLNLINMKRRGSS